MGVGQGGGTLFFHELDLFCKFELFCEFKLLNEFSEICGFGEIHGLQDICDRCLGTSCWAVRKTVLSMACSAYSLLLQLFPLLSH